MRIDPLTQYTKLREQLEQEKTQLEARLREIHAVLVPTDMFPAAGQAAQPVAVVTSRGRGANALTMREAITKALSERGPLARKELAQAVVDVGYVSNAKDPLSSMGIVLYARNSPFKKKGGKFYFPKVTGPAGVNPNSDAAAPAKKKRVMSPEAREKIAAAQRARWAKAKRMK